MAYNVMEIPDGESGPWKVSTFEVTEDDIRIENLRAMFKPGCRTMKASKYKRLTRNGFVVMSNTPAEIADYRHFVRHATGAVHINGLGLGCVLAEVLNKPDVNMVVVVEISPDVISLVSPYFESDPRVKFICANAFEYKPPKDSRYDAVWHDIWDNICADNLDEMGKLHRKFGKKTDYQDSWCKDLCKRYRGR
jgi:hypothetical protein